MACVAPEHIAPTIAFTFSEVTNRSPVATAAAVSAQVESPVTATTLLPPSNDLLSATSEIAICAPLFMAGASDSNGPVKPSEIPIFISSAYAGEASIKIAAETPIIFFIIVSHLIFSLENLIFKK